MKFVFVQNRSNRKRSSKCFYIKNDRKQKQRKVKNDSTVLQLVIHYFYNITFKFKKSYAKILNNSSESAN